MYKNVKKNLHAQANNSIPDKWDNIREEAVQILPQKKLAACKSPRRVYRLATLAASLCVVIALTVVALPNLMNNGNSAIGNDNTHGNTTLNTPPNSTVVADKIIWNNSPSEDSLFLRASTLKKVSEKEWLEKYPLHLPESLQFEYSFAYPIPTDGPKEGDVLTDRMNQISGHLDGGNSEGQWISIYVSASDGTVPEFINPRFKKSTIDGIETVIGKHEEQIWGGFMAQSHWISFEAHNFDEAAIIDLIKEFNK